MSLLSVPGPKSLLTLIVAAALMLEMIDGSIGCPIATPTVP
jgi:hypothetical protein